jgi:ABC-2 type transport system permease protein
MMLSGFLFEISLMPRIIQWITYVVPARYPVPLAAVGIPAGDLWRTFLRRHGHRVASARFFSRCARPPADCLMHGRLYAIIVKEMWALLRDPRSRLILVVPPFLQLFLFGFATTLEVKNFDVGVYDRDGGRWSQEFIQRLGGSPNVGRIVSLSSPEGVRAAINDRAVIAVVMFEQQFSADVSAHRPAVIEAVLDGRRSNAAQIVAGYLGVIAAGMGAELVADVGASATGPRSETVTSHWYNPNLDYLWFTMPALIVVLGTVSGLAMTAQSVARERELGTFDQLMVSPLRVHEILIGKMVPPLIIGLLNAALYVP